MQKNFSIVLGILLLWVCSCDHDETRPEQATSENKITITDLEHEPAVKDLLSKVQGSPANGRVSRLETAEAFFKYSEPDSGILNYTFRLPDDSPDYFENLVLSQYEDGFYGFIYHYIPDGPYIAGDSFKGTLQQYNLTGELIREFTLPVMQDSAAAGGRTQLMNQCVRSIEQTCTTIYQVETRTDYPCHCQYDHKTVVSSVCTFSFNRGWCDDMIAEPPAGGGGTYIGASDAAPRSGGAGGSTSTPKPVKNPVVVVPEPGFDDITFYSVKSPCLVSVIKNLMREDFKNKINQNAKHWFIDAEQVQNLNFKELSTILNDENNPIHAHTSSAYTTPGKIQNVDITLNSSTLPGTSELFQIVAIYHETTHAILNMNTTYQKMLPKEKHEFMSSPSRTLVMIDALKEVYNRDLTTQEAQKVAALWLYSFSDAMETSNFQASMDKWHLTSDNIIKVGEQEERVVKITANGQTKIKSVGGPVCNKD
jgi:hypothetical protein